MASTDALSNTTATPDTLYSTTDDDLIKFLITMKVPILKTEKNAKNRTVFYFSRCNAQPHLEHWISGAPILVEIRDAFQSHKIFNMRVHDEC